MSTYIRYVYNTDINPARVQENTILKRFYSIKSRKVDPDKEGIGIEMEKLYGYIRKGHPEARDILIIQTYDKDTSGTLGLKGTRAGTRPGMETAFKRGRNTGNFD